MGRTLKKYLVVKQKLFEKTASALYKNFEGSDEFRRFVKPDS